MSTPNDFIETAEQAIIIARVLDAPRELMWKAWTEPERIKRWWGPRGFTCPIAEVDLRVGGEYFNCMRSSEGQDYWSKGVYQEIVEPERIVTTDSFSDAEGNVIPASDYGMTGDWPMEMLVTATFEELDGKTQLTLRHVGIPPGENSDMCEAGWSESFDKLAEYLAGEIEG